MGNIEADLLAALEQAAQAAQAVQPVQPVQPAEDEASKGPVAAAVAEAATAVETAATDAAAKSEPPRSEPEPPSAVPTTATSPPLQTPSAPAESRSHPEPTPLTQLFAERPPPLHQASEPPPAQPRSDVTPSMHPPRPTSAPQDTETVIKHESPPPGEASRSLLKRSRSPAPESDRGDEKRIKTDVDDELDGAGVGHADNDTVLDELARMIQNAESSVDGPMHGPMHLDATMLDMQLNGALDADFGGVLHGIHDSEHSKMVDSILASLSQHDMGTDYLSAGSQHHTDPDGSHDLAMSEAPVKKRSLWSNHEHYTRQAQILPTLGRVAVDILRALSEQTLEDTIATLNAESESPIWKEYLELKAFFDALRKMFSDDFPLLFPDQLEGINSPEEHEMVRVANLATMCASMFGLNELGWPDLNNNFLQNFLAKSCPMTAAVSDLCLVFKTQMFFGLAESNPEASREELLEELFVTGVKETLQQRHPDIPLTAVENQFLAKSEQRKTMLLEGSHSPESFQVLTTSYTYEAFLDSLSTHINDCMGTIEKLGTGQPGSAPTADDILLHEDFGHDLGSNFDLEGILAEAAKAAETVGDGHGHNHNHNQEEPVSNFEELAKLLTEGISRHGQEDQANGVSEMPQSVASNHENANRVTRLALDHIHHNQYRPTAAPQPSSYANNNQLHPSYQAPQQQSQTQQPYYQYNQQTAATAPNSHQTTPSNDTLPPNQSESTPALYERARQAAAARSSTHARREGSHSTRRPWSAEEEKALMLGLDMVKGPHWSQILSLFGPSGSISQILADRTQVQLKDKARNLKLFFLKTNSEMPYYLHCVTGELKTRAPTQAARKEAEERARLNSQDEQDRMNGILALGNMQGQRTATAATAQRSVTPATASQSTHGLPHAHSNMARTGQAQAGAPVQGHTGAAQGIARTSTTHPTHYPRPAQPQPGQSQAYTQSPAQQNQQHPQQQASRPPQGQPQGQATGQSAPRPQGQGQPQGVSQGQVQGQAAGQNGGQAAARPPTQGQPQIQGQGHAQGQQAHGGQAQGQAQRQVQGQAPIQAQGQVAQGPAVQGQPQGQGQVHGQHQNHAQGQMQPQQQTRPQGQPQARPQYPVQHPGQPSQQQAPQSHYQHRPQAPNSSQPQTQQHSPAQQQHTQQSQRPQQPAQAHPAAGVSQQPPRPQQNVQPQGQMQRPQTQPQAQPSHQAPQGPNHQRHHSQPQPQSQAPGQSQGQGQGQMQHQPQPQHAPQHQTQQQSGSQHQQPSNQAPRQAQTQQPQQQHVQQHAQQHVQQHVQQPAYRQPAQQHAASQASPRPAPSTQQPVHQQPAHRPNGQQTGLAQAQAPAPAPAPAVKEEPVKHEPMDPDEAHLLPIKEALEREARESSGAHNMDHDAHMEPEALAALIAASVSGVQ